MGEGPYQRARLGVLLEENSQLSQKAWENGRLLEQCLAARKDVMRGGARLNGEPAFPAVSKSERGVRANVPVVTPKTSDFELRHASRERCPVLILVEDNPDDFTLLKRALWKVGASARVWWAKDGTEALDILEQVGSPGSKVCMVSDVKLPQVDGFELLRRVKASCGSLQLKFAFLTGDHDKNTEARAHACGADGFFLKPTRWEDLVETARALQRLALQP